MQRLKPRQVAAATLLSKGFRQCEVAEQIGASRESIWRWSRSPAFVAKVEAIQNEALQGVSASLSGLCDDAVAVLHRLVSDPETPPNIQLAAAKEILDRAERFQATRPELTIEERTRRLRHLSDEELLALEGLRGDSWGDRASLRIEETIPLDPKPLQT